MKICNKNDIMIIMGDFNAKVGNDNIEYERFMGIDELGTQNENAENTCMYDFCHTNGLVITGTFLHKDIQKATWVFANKRVKNQIDHLLINGRLKSLVFDTKVMKGADANSDH